ncbi:hypothetical protein, partial [Pseudomonas aeruginosa]|uniref:hypothetical protein n=1 Tax=Pseudomonas aeruginosa TaxID=287 RepID=UPI001C130B59
GELDDVEVDIADDEGEAQIGLGGHGGSLLSRNSSGRPFERGFPSQARFPCLAVGSAVDVHGAPSINDARRMAVSKSEKSQNGRQEIPRLRATNCLHFRGNEQPAH